jgi:hypothetical protein
MSKVTKALREAWRRGPLRQTAEECGFIGSHSAYVVGRIAKILERDPVYCQRIFESATEAIEQAFLIETPTNENLKEAHSKAVSVLRALAPSFYVMGMMVGYVAARGEILEAKPSQPPPAQASE